MRSLTTAACCAAYLTFAVMVGVAHVHEATDHHGETHGLHLDHVHMGEQAVHGHTEHHAVGSSDDGAECNDAHSLTACVDVSPRTPPRVVSVTVETLLSMDAPALVSRLGNDRLEQLRGPPRQIPIPPRAPPA